jgi:hypothetical protein
VTIVIRLRIDYAPTHPCPLFSLHADGQSLSLSLDPSGSGRGLLLRHIHSVFLVFFFFRHLSCSSMVSSANVTTFSFFFLSVLCSRSVWVRIEDRDSLSHPGLRALIFIFIQLKPSP